jgi:hypothetical protein
MDENPKRRNLQKDSLQERGTQRTSHPRWQHVGSGAHCSDLQASARSLGLTLVTDKASAESDLESAFAAMVKGGATALFVASDPSYTAFQEQIALRAVRHAMPTMFANRSAVTVGGLKEGQAGATLLRIGGSGTPHHLYAELLKA